MGTDLFFQVIFLFVFCLVLAALESQIEGETGWASNLPTRKIPISSWYASFFRKIMSGKDMTVYHLFIFSLVFIFMHYPYFVGKQWNWPSEFSALSLFFLMTIFWDFLWFVINPRYDFWHFLAEKVWWHKKWLWHLPIDYWFALIISVILYARFSFNWELLKEWLEIIGLFSIFTIIVILFAIAAGIFRVKEFKK